MSSAVPQNTSDTSNDKKMARSGAVLLLVGGALLWLASRMTWVEVAVFDDKSGSSVIELVGSTWSTETTALALLMLAAGLAGFVLRRWGRRIVGVIAAVAAVGASWSPLTVMMGVLDVQRAHQLLTSGAASQRASQPVSISSWAEVTSMDAWLAGPAVALLGCSVALVGGVLLAMKPGTDGAKLNRYERKKQREERLAEDLADSPDSGRVMWDALDADIDPTEVGRGSSA